MPPTPPNSPDHNPLAGLSAERLLRAQPFPVWICDPDTLEVRVANGAACRHLGCLSGEMRGHRLHDGVPPAASEGGCQSWLLRRCDGTVVRTPVVPTRLEGDSGGWLLVTALPVGCCEMRRSDDDLLRDAKRESLELLAGGVAHDFNNLLTALLGNLSLARLDSELDGSVQEWLSEAEKAAARARELTHQLLTFAKGGEPVRRLLDAGECVLESARFARQGSRVRCESSIERGLWPVEADAGQIGQVVQNLVLNAVQAMPGGGVVRVGGRNLAPPEATRLGLGAYPYVEIEVRDEGPGIRPEDMARIFQPYFTTKATGSGLGLATSQMIARRHRGALRVESVPGLGAAFRLYLPASPGAELGDVPDESEVERLSGRVLFMDDEEAIRAMSVRLLGRIGLDAEAVGDGAAAVEAYGGALADGRRFDLVILDLTVPAGQGALETVRRLREIDPDVRVIVSSGYVDDPVLREFRRHGFGGRVTKPYCLSELAAELRRVLAPVVATE